MPALDLFGEREITDYMRRAFGNRARIEGVATSPHVSSRGRCCLTYPNRPLRWTYLLDHHLPVPVKRGGSSAWLLHSVLVVLRSVGG